MVCDRSLTLPGLKFQSSPRSQVPDFKGTLGQTVLQDKVFIRIMNDTERQGGGDSEFRPLGQRAGSLTGFGEKGEVPCPVVDE